MDIDVNIFIRQATETKMKFVIMKYGDFQWSESKRGCIKKQTRWFFYHKLGSNTCQ
jgi:hypothetical protein